MIQKLEYINSNGIGYAPSIEDVIAKINEVITIVNTQTDVLTDAELLPRPEWGDVDEENLDAVIELTEHTLYEPLVPRGKLIDWLKSLRPHWKPSEEQMEALRETIDFAPDTFKPKCSLESLYKDLKKLK